MVLQIITQETKKMHRYDVLLNQEKQKCVEGGVELFSRKPIPGLENKR